MQKYLLIQFLKTENYFFNIFLEVCKCKLKEETIKKFRTEELTSYSDSESDNGSDYDNDFENGKKK